jgi:ornithine cyclodeaminase
MQIIKDSDVARLLDYRSVVSTLERAFSDLAQGRAAIHARQRTDCASHKLSTMGALWHSESIAGVKVYPTSTANSVSRSCCSTSRRMRSSPSSTEMS